MSSLENAFVSIDASNYAKEGLTWSRLLLQSFLDETGTIGKLDWEVCTSHINAPDILLVSGGHQVTSPFTDHLFQGLPA